MSLMEFVEISIDSCEIIVVIEAREHECTKMNL